MIGILKIIAVKWSEAKAPNIFNTDAGDQIWLVKGKDKKSEGNVWILISYYSIKKKNKKNTQDEEYKLNSGSRRQNKPAGKREGL